MLKGNNCAYVLTSFLAVLRRCLQDQILLVCVGAKVGTVQLELAKLRLGITYVSTLQLLQGNFKASWRMEIGSYRARL